MKLSPFRKCWPALVLAVIGILGLATGAYAQTGAGAIEGKVTDKDGGALPGVTVVATNPATGFTRSATTEADGSFRLPALPAATYQLVYELSGFGTVTQEGVKVNVGSTRPVAVTMQVASVEESITVTSEAPLIANEPSIGTVVSQKELESLPLNGRQFANLAVLAPGTSLAYNSDPTKPGQLTIALNGGIGRNVNFVMDGGDNTDDTIGGALQNFNLEAVAEFKIQTGQYKAEYGRSSGGVLSVVTKTGTNDFSGSVYGFFRDDSLNSKTESEKLAGIDKQPYERKQYGASLGGPIVRDKAHFFATYEKTDRTTQYSVDSGGIVPSLDGTSVSLPFKDELITAKATYDVSAKQYLQVRYGYQKNSDKYGASPLAAPDALGTVTNKYSSLLAGHTLQLGGDRLNELVFQYTKFNNAITADSNSPTLYYPSGFFQGQNINTPQTTNQTKYQFRDDFSWSMDLGGQRHDFKTGVNYVHEPTLGGDFSTGVNGQFSLLEDRAGSPVSDITIFGGFFGDDTPVDQYSVYFQDDWSVNDRLTLNVGLRYDYWDGFDLDQRTNPIWQTLSSQTTYNEYYLRDFQGGKGGKLSNDTNNWGPRLGFTWDASGDGRRVLRGGFGRFYDFPYTNATILFPAAAVQSTYGVVYNNSNPNGIRNADGTFFQPGQPLPPNQLPAADIPPPNEVASPTLATPYSDQISLGYSWQATNWLGLNFEAVSIRYRDIPFRFRANPRDPATGARRFPQYGNFRIWYGNGKADYDGLNIGFRVRRDKFELQGFYTYSETDGNVLAGADEFRLTDAGYQPSVRIARDVSVNPLDPLCSACFGPLNTDSKHRFTFGGTYQAPWGINVSGMFRYRSATPYTLHAAVDLNGDGFRMDLPAGVSHVNSKRGDSFSQFDLRLSREFTFGNGFGIELIAEMFNVFNEKNPAAFTPVFDASGLPTGQLEANTYAGDPLQGEQRLIQLGARFRF